MTERVISVINKPIGYHIYQQLFPNEVLAYGWVQLFYSFFQCGIFIISILSPASAQLLDFMQLDGYT